MNAFFYGSQQNASIFAEFSLPRSGENCRGYVAYEIKAKESDWWIDSWLNYTHQKTIWQYPVISAARTEDRAAGWTSVCSVLCRMRCRCFQRGKMKALSVHKLEILDVVGRNIMTGNMIGFVIWAMVGVIIISLGIKSISFRKSVWLLGKHKIYICK